ncbi:YbaB/EbfC family nucleoid-associated protein [Gammaproteobacteria bacterium]|jgi:DNA-binding protein YbaB|nr:YbaB/EbfC family nucleoid-associated protein [Gammaproteobacteria bacterium]
MEKPSILELMKTAKALQSKMKAQQSKLKDATFKAKKGVFSVTKNGEHHIKEILIDDQWSQLDKQQIINDLTSLLNDLNDQIKDFTKNQIKNLSDELKE